MEVNDLLKIKNQFNRYNLYDTVEDIEYFISELDEEKLNNLLSIDFEIKKDSYLYENRYILLDNNLLKSKHYLEDIKCLYNIDNKYEFSEIRNLFMFSSFINNPYLKEDIEMILNARKMNFKEKIINYLKGAELLNFKNEVFRTLLVLARSAESFSKPYHLKDMNLIKNTDSYAKVQALKMTAINQESLNSNFHEYHMDSIFNSNDIKACGLCKIATNQYSINSPYHIEDMELIKQQKHENTIDALTSIAISEESLNSKHHKEDMNLLSKQYLSYKIFVLQYLAINKKSLDSIHHRDDMNMISECNHMELCRMLESVASSPDSLNSPYHKEDMQLIVEGFKKSKDIAGYMEHLACSRLSLENKYHKEDMNYICNAKNKFYAKLLFDVATNEKSLTSEHHIKDMELISCASNKIIAKYLSNLATDFVSLSNENHRYYMNLLANAKDNTRCRYIYEAIINKLHKSNQEDDQHMVSYDEVTMIANSKSNKEAGKICKDYAKESNDYANLNNNDNFLALNSLIEEANLKYKDQDEQKEKSKTMRKNK